MRNAYGVVEEFERRMASFAGAKYGIAVESCSAALFLCCKYLGVGEVTIPARTYCSVPMQIIHAGGRVKFADILWRGLYQLKPYPIWDAAKRMRSGMYEGGYQCLSFHGKKRLNIGRGGMILTDDEDSVEWFHRARYDGRSGVAYPQEKITMLGWNMYMTPEQAARGLQILDLLEPDLPDQEEDYPDLRQHPAFQ